MNIYQDKSDSKFWRFKYCPKKTKDITINKDKVNLITLWLDNYFKNKENAELNNKKKKIGKQKISTEDDTTITEEITEVVITKKNNNTMLKSCLLVSGSHGCGKTSTVYSILNSLKYKIYNIDNSKINLLTNIKNFIETTIFGKNINTNIHNNENEKKILVIDNVEYITSTNEKNFIEALIKYNDVNWVFPIIFISNNKHNKIIQTINKFSFEVDIPQPTIDIISDIAYKVAYKEKIIFETENIITKIIEYSQSDIRALITNLQTIKELYKDKVITMNDYEIFIKTCKMKDIDYGIFEAAHKLFFGYDNIDNVIRIFETEKTVIPLMIQQHYIDYLKNNNIDLVNRISKSIAQGDIIENYIYENNIYDIRDVQAFHECILPSYILSNKLNPKKTNYSNFQGKFTFPYDLNKTSIRFINYRKNISPAKKVFKNMSICDFLYVNKLTKGIFKTNNFKEYNELLKGYNCNLQILESVLKIDKINGIKYVISTKTKKRIKQDCKDVLKIDDDDKNKDN